MEWDPGDSWTTEVRTAGTEAHYGTVNVGATVFFVTKHNETDVSWATVEMHHEKTTLCPSGWSTCCVSGRPYVESQGEFDKGHALGHTAGTSPLAPAAALLRTGLADLQVARWIHYCQKAGIPVGGCQRAAYCEPPSGEEIIAELRDAGSVLIVGCSLCANTIYSLAKDLPLRKSSAWGLKAIGTSHEVDRISGVLSRKGVRVKSIPSMAPVALCCESRTEEHGGQPPRKASRGDRERPRAHPNEDIQDRWQGPHRQPECLDNEIPARLNRLSRDLLL